MPEFVHLHNHTEFSLLDGASKVGELARHVRELGMPAVAMTDHGNLYGAVHFYKAARQAELEPIVGCELYVAPGSRFDRKVVDQTEVAYHLVALAIDETGYRNLNRLVTAGFFEGFYYKPRIDWELLTRHHEGLVILSGCLQGELAKAILADDRNEARAIARRYRDLLGDRYYLEIQANGLPEQERINAAKIELARELGIGLVATNDNHYLRKEDAFAHDVLLCIGTHKKLEDPDRLRFPNDQFYVKSAEEMWERFRTVPDALENTLRIAERNRFAFRFGEVHLPRFAGPDEDLGALLVQAAREGLERRFLQLERSGRSLDEERRRVYRERLEYELGVIRQMGFAGYFLIVSDFIRWAKEHGIPVGPGRGSAAGSLVGWSLAITEIDPIRFGLLFERFLNPERASMPDIDVDICMNRRGEVIEYVTERYGGRDHVAQIAAFGTAKGRQIFKDVGRVYGLSFSETDRITKLMPAPPADFELASLLHEDEELRRAVEADPRLREVYEVAGRLEGITRNASVHAAGVVISDRPLVDYLPLHKGEHGETVTQFDMTAVEAIGLVKFDFLGLKTLTAMHAAVELIREHRGEEIDLDAIPEDDAKTYELLSAGETAGVFQLESEGMRRLLKQLQPRKLDEVIAVTALYRPGPMQSGMLDEYVARKNGQRPVTYPLPQLEPILAETYGVIVYQEQVMEIARVLAGYSLGEADILRKAMGKKKPEVMAEQRQRFVEGCVANGIDRRQAEELFDLIAEFAGYGFNKSHSAAYGLIAYRTAWLKAHYPVEFMAALMRCDQDKPQKLVPLLREARRMGIEILPPDVNLSGETFTPDGERIRFGLAAIKNVGGAPVAAILAARTEQGGRFANLTEFLSSVDPGVLNRKVLESFVKSGALDTFGHPRRTLWENLDRILEWLGRTARDRAAGQHSLFGETEVGFEELSLQETEEWNASERAEAERETIGFYLSAHPIRDHLEEIGRFANTTLAAEELGALPDRTQIRFGAVVTAVKTKNSPKGRRAFVTVEDLEGTAEVGVFGETYQRYKELLVPGRVLFFVGDLMVDAEGGRRIFAKELTPIEDLAERRATLVRLHVPIHLLADGGAQRLVDDLLEHPGDLPVEIHVAFEGGATVVLAPPRELRIQPGPALSETLRRDLGEIRVAVEVA